jgi:large subunit ribosomal protein L11
MLIKLLVEGGSMKPGPALSQKLGPAGIPINKVLEKVNEATKNFKGMKVPVELDVNVETKEISVQVFSPPVSELLKKELNIEKGSELQKKINSANASIEQIIKVAKIKFPNLLCKDLNAAVKTVLGSCVSLGILVENNSPIEIISKINKGNYANEIKEEKIETDLEKKEELKKYFEELNEKQEKIVKATKEEAKIKEETKEETKEDPKKKKK